MQTLPALESPTPLGKYFQPRSRAMCQGYKSPQIQGRSRDDWIWPDALRDAYAAEVKKEKSLTHSYAFQGSRRNVRNVLCALFQDFFNNSTK